MTKTTDVMHLWHLCQTAYLRHNIRLSFPKDTAPERTYQSRYLASLAQRLEAWDLSESLHARFIDTVAKYAVSKGLQRKGLSIFMQKNILEECCKRMVATQDDDDTKVAIITETHQRLASYADKVTTFLARKTFGGFTNLTEWYQQKTIGDLYLAISRPCTIALYKLSVSDRVERSMLPPVAQLYVLRNKLLKNAELQSRLRDILGNDWRTV
jgi:hypothetical protein